MATAAPAPVASRSSNPTAGHGAVAGAAPERKGVAVAVVDEPQEKPKLDVFDAKHTGAPSPDVSGMLDDTNLDDDQGDIDPATMLPAIPARSLQSHVKA